IAPVLLAGASLACSGSHSGAGRGGGRSASVAARSIDEVLAAHSDSLLALRGVVGTDRKSTRLNSSLDQISYAVFCLKKKIKIQGFIQTLAGSRTNADIHIDFDSEFFNSHNGVSFGLIALLSFSILLD